MINFIKNTNMSNQVFVSEVLKQSGVTFAPKYIHTGAHTIEGYLCQFKYDVNIDELKPILETLKLDDVNIVMTSLEEEDRVLVHLLSHLFLDVKRVILEIPENTYSDDFYTKLFFLLDTYNCADREITLITDNKRITEHTTGLDSANKLKIKLYTQNNSTFDIFKRFLGRKPFVLASLFTAILIVAAIVTVDSRVSTKFSSFFEMPNNIVTIHNQSTDCSFNQSVFNLDADDCESSASLSYLEVKDLLNNEYVNAIYFDNQYLIDEFNTNLATHDKVTASIPNLYFEGLEDLETLPCVSDEYTPEMVTCTPYSADTSLISVASKSETSALDQNIKFNQDLVPEYIFIEANNTELLLEDLVTAYPNFNLYTSKTIEKYVRSSNQSFIIRVLVIGTLISFALAYFVFSLLDLLGLSPRGLKYYFVYHTHRPFLVNKLYFSAQIGYYLVLNIIGTLITANVTHSTTAFLIGIYFGALNSTIWLVFAFFSGREFRHSEDLLRKYIKYSKVVNNKKELNK